MCPNIKSSLCHTVDIPAACLPFIMYECVGLFSTISTRLFFGAIKRSASEYPTTLNRKELGWKAKTTCAINKDYQNWFLKISNSSQNVASERNPALRQNLRIKLFGPCVFAQRRMKMW